MRTPVRKVGPAIGIDIGTAYSCVGIWQKDAVEIIPNELGSRTTPSYVAFTKSGRLIGDSAKNQVNTNPNNTVFDVKRLIGRKFSDSSLQKAMKLWPFKVVAGAGDKPRIVVNYKGQEKQLSPEEIMAMIIVRMKEIAEVYLGLKVEFVVCTVPVCFNTSQRQAMVDASLIAGINNMRLVNEPSAAVIAYDLPRIANESTVRKVLIFDLGSGSLNVSVFEIEEGIIFDAIASTGKSDLGGGDFVDRMVHYFVKEFEKKHQKRINGDTRAIRRLWNSCERAKRTLSTNSDVVIEIDSFFQGIDFSFKLSRAKFEQLNMYLFYKCLESVEKCLVDSSLYEDDLYEIVLVGGSTRIPKIQQLLKEMFNGRELCKGVNQDEAVAYGAAVHASVYNGASCDVINILLLDSISHSLGFTNNKGSMSVMMPKNATIPNKVEKMFLVSELLNKEQRIKVYEGEELRASYNNFLGEVDVSWISDLQVTDEIHVSFDVSANRVVGVSFEERKSGRNSKVTVTNAMRLSKGEISRMVEESEKFKVDDEKHKKDIEAKNDLENLAYNMKKRVEEKASNSNRRFVVEAVDEVIQWLDCNQAAHAADFEDKMKELHIICDPFLS